MLLMKSGLTVPLLLCSTLVNASGEETPALDIIEIHGQQTEGLSPLDLPGSHTRINLSEAANSTLAIEDILNQQSGIQIRSIGGRGQFSYPSIRGASGKQLQILWDGIPLSTLNGMEGNLPSVGMSSLEAIDIYRGTAPVELAPTAIGGTINLRSRQHSNHNSEGNAYLAAGSFGYGAAGGWHASGSETWQIFTAADYMQAENDFSVSAANSSVDSDASSVKEKRENNAAEHTTAIFRADYQGLMQWKPSFLFQHLDKRQELAGLRNIKANEAYTAETTNNLSLLLDHQADKNQHTTMVLTLSETDETYDDQGDNIGLGRQKNIYSNTGILARLNQTYKYKKTDYLFTASIRSEDSDAEYRLKSDSTVRSDCLSGNDCPYSYTRNQYHLGTRITHQLTHATLLNTQLSYLQLSDRQNAVYGLTETENNESFISGDIGADIWILSHTTFGILFSSQVRPVTTQELFGDRGLTLGNPDLKAERSQGVDLTLSSFFTLGEWSLSGYYRTREDAISASADSRGVIRYDNFSSTRHTGAEVTIDLNITSSVSIKGNSGWHNQIITDHIRPAFIGNRVPNQRTWDHYYALQYMKNNWSSAIAYTRQAGGFYESTNLLAIPLRSQVNFWAGYTLTDLTFRFEANNLTNNRVSDFYHYPVPGRNFAFKTSYRW